MADEMLQALLAVSAEEVASWPQAEQDWFERELARAIALRSPADFAVAHSRGRWQPYRHLRFTSDAIVDMIEEDTCDLLLVDQCVRHGKTELCSRWTPAWFTVKYQERRSLLSSYEADFAATHGRVVRDYVKEFGPLYGCDVSESSKAAARWDLTNGVGGMGTAGAGGPIIGKGGHLMIVDDPVKNFDEANSKVYRDKLWDWWQNVWLGRREPGAKLVLIMSRWHQDDLVGRLENGETGLRIQHLRMPAVAEENDILGREVGEALCPERYDEEALAKTRIAVGPIAWASQYQQRPTTRGGGLLRPTEHLKYFTKMEVGSSTYYECEDRLIDDSECSRFSTFDVAFTNRSRSDYTVMATMVIAPGDPTLMLILNIERRRTTHAEHADMLESTWNGWGPSWIGIEKQNATLSVFDEAQRRGVVVRWLLPDKNKTARAETLAGMMASGRVWVPRDAPWLADMIDEFAAFPVGTHDDQVDAISYAAIETVKRHVHPRRAKKAERSRDEEIWDRVMAGKKKDHTHPILGRWP